MSVQDAAEWVCSMLPNRTLTDQEGVGRHEALPCSAAEVRSGLGSLRNSNLEMEDEMDLGSVNWMAVIVDLTSLNGRKRLEKYDVFSLIRY